MNRQTTCRELLEHLSAYFDGELPAPECDRIEAHCRDCAECRALVEGLRGAMDLCQKARRAPVPASIRRRARARVRALLRGPRGNADR